MVTKAELIRDLRARRFSETGAKRAAESFIDTMLFAGLMVQVGDEYLGIEAAQKLRENIASVRHIERRGPQP